LGAANKAGEEEVGGPLEESRPPCLKQRFEPQRPGSLEHPPFVPGSGPQRVPRHAG